MQLYSIKAGNKIIYGFGNFKQASTYAIYKKMKNSSIKEIVSDFNGNYPIPKKTAVITFFNELPM